jgi:hypothetical protein
VPFEEDRSSANFSSDVSVRVARADESVLVASVLTEASVRLERRGMPLWEARDVDQVAVAGEVASGNYALAFDADSAVGTVRLTRRLGRRSTFIGSQCAAHTATD